MTSGFLLDVHIPIALARALQQLAPDMSVQHIAHWRGGTLRTASDEDILSAAVEGDLVFVTCDVRTVAPIADALIAAGRSLPGVVFLPGSRALLLNVGAIAPALVHLLTHADMLDPAYPVAYLQVQ